MNSSGDAAETIVRLSLEGMEVALKITGAAAKEIAILLIAALKNNEKNLKLKGKTRLVAMLKSGKSLEIFSVKDSDLKKFHEGAKQYGIVYCALRNSTKDGLCDVLVKADDAPKISRLVERFNFATVDRVKLEKEITRSKGNKGKGSEPSVPDKVNVEELLDDLLGIKEGMVKDNTEPIEVNPDIRDDAPVEETQKTPFPERTEKSLLSGLTLDGKNKSVEGTLNERTSVREKLKEIMMSRQSKEETEVSNRNNRTTNIQKTNQSTVHKQPQRNKPKKPRGRS